MLRGEDYLRSYRGKEGKFHIKHFQSAVVMLSQGRWSDDCGPMMNI
jgi:hypothetical protein